ncbi:MAG: GDP-mannose 4,6-dehydratase [bacterium]|nr:GDP-mannose 4,6-dehydratase [bacterium]
MRVLVTGAGGFAGAHVTAALHAAGHAAHALVHGPGPGPADAAAVHRGDVCDAEELARLVRTVAPEAVVHLAAFANPAAAEHDPAAAYRVNVGGTLALLGALRAQAPGARLLLVSSCLVYGDVPRAEPPVDEAASVAPRTVYGASKAAAEITALQWARAYGLDVVVARPFNHTGPGQAPSYVCAALARQVAAIEAGRQEPVLHTGNPDPVRDLVDVRDVAAAYLALLARGRRGTVYNVCTGGGSSVAEIVAQLRTLARVPLTARIDPARTRPGDAERLVGSPARIAADTGWQARIPLADTLADVLGEWRARPDA